MSKAWFCQIMGKEIGPLTSQQLLDIAGSGRLRADDLVRQSNSEHWTTAGHVKGLFDQPDSEKSAKAKSATSTSGSAVPPPPPFLPPIDRLNEGAISSFPRAVAYSSFVQKNLLPDERIVIAARIHPLIFLPAAVLFICLLIGIVGLSSHTHRGPDDLVFASIPAVFLIVGLLSPYFAIKALIIFLTTECMLTNKRVIGKHGFISRDSLELLLSKVEGLHVSQSILGRYFDFGSVIVSGTGGSKTPFHGIIHPLDFRKRVQEQIAIVQG